MGIFDKSKKDNNQKEENKFEKLYSMACDYDGYDMVFLENFTNPGIYAQINNIITNGKAHMDAIDTYKDLTKNSNIDEFYTFYEDWTEYLRKRGFIVRLDNDVSIENFVDGINNMMKINGYDIVLNKNSILDIYKQELAGMGIDSMVNYDILIANTVAVELRKFDLELIDLFDGFDNCDFTIIPIDKIDVLKKLEEKIK